MDKIRCWLICLMIAASQAYAQDADSLSAGAGSLFSPEDSLSIFSLIDSLLSLEDAAGSQLALRMGYNSNVLSAGRTLGIENFGLAPGVSYYHRSGLYADLSGYWSKDFESSYYLTVASLGYMGDFSRRFSLMAGYDRYFYHTTGEDNYIPYRNTLSATPILEFKPLSLSVNYSFYFGDQRAHRIMPGLSLTLEKKKLWNIDRIAFLPSVFALMGNEVITAIEFVPPKTLREAVDNVRKNGTRFRVEETRTPVFGMMNYTFSAPVSVTYKQWMLTFTWAYNIPKALPGETLTLSESTYLSGSVMYIIDLRRNKNTL